MLELVIVSALGILGAVGALGVALHHTYQIEVLQHDRSQQDTGK